jgi:hypothetical protein
MMICGNCGFDDASVQGFCKQCGASASRFIASCDTHPKDGDVEQAPLVSGAVPERQTPRNSPCL